MKTHDCEGKKSCAEEFLRQSFLTLKGARWSQVHVEQEYVHISLLRIKDLNFCHTVLLLASSLRSQITDDNTL